VGFCSQRLEELSVTSSRLENEIKSLRRAAYPDSKDGREMSHPSSHQGVARQQQQQHLLSELSTKVWNKCIRVTFPNWGLMRIQCLVSLDQQPVSKIRSVKVEPRTAPY